MKSLSDYTKILRDTATNLNLHGESVEMLVQMLANALYISEVEHITYSQEASLERASLENSKIQHCVDNMYSVFRGTCPRVMMKIKPSKYITLNPYDLMVTSNNFNIYYLGYYKVTAPGEKESATRSTTSITSTTSAIGTSKIIDTTDVSIDESGENQGTNAGPSIEGLSIDELLKYGYTGSWEYSSATFYPAVDDSDIQILIGFLAPKRIGDKLTVDKIINSNNTYYIDCTANNLSDDMYVEIVQSNGSRERLARTRVFAEHILEHKIFDLTLPSFGSRLFFANYYKDTIGRDSRSIVGMTENTNIHAQFYGYSELGDYNEPELKRVQYKGAELVKFSSEFLKENTVTETSDGLCYIEAIPRDGLNTIHYKASRDRYVSSIIRSNSDIGIYICLGTNDTVWDNVSLIVNQVIVTNIPSSTMNDTLRKLWRDNWKIGIYDYAVIPNSTSNTTTKVKTGGPQEGEFVFPSRQIIAGEGLTGGGSLSSDVSIAVNFGITSNTVARGNHNHDSSYTPLHNTDPDIPNRIAIYDNNGKLTSYKGFLYNKLDYLKNLNQDIMELIGGKSGPGHTHSNISIKAGDGLGGGGTLDQDRYLWVNFGTTWNTVARGDHNHSGVYEPLINMAAGANKIATYNSNGRLSYYPGFDASKLDYLKNLNQDIMELINNSGGSDPDHNHDGRYLKLTGGTVQAT